MLWLNYLASSDQRQRFEAATMIQLLEQKHVQGSLDSNKISLPPSVYTKGDYNLGDVLFGGAAMSCLELKKNELCKHMCIVGRTGSGKTNMSLNLVDSLLSDGVPVWIVDWKRSYRSLIRKHPNVIVFTLGRKVNPLQWNPLIPPRGAARKSWHGVVCDVLERSHVSGQGVADVLIEQIEKQVQQGVDERHITFAELHLALQRMKYPGRKGLWQQSALRILRSLSYGPAEDFNSTSTVSLEELLTRPVIFELDMSMPKNLRAFFSELLLRWLHAYRLGQGESEKLRHVLVLEEVHNLMNGAMDTSNPLESVFRELRSFGQGAVAITQHPSLLPIWLLGNVHLLVCFGLSHAADIESARKAFFLDYDSSSCLDRLAVGSAIVKVTGRVSPCHVRFPKNGSNLVRVKDSEVERDANENMD